MRMKHPATAAFRFALCGLVATMATSVRGDDTSAQAERGFVLNGVEWSSQEAFIRNGARCATVHPDAARMAEIDREVAAILAQGVHDAATGGDVKNGTKLNSELALPADAKRSRPEDLPADALR